MRGDLPNKGRFRIISPDELKERAVLVTVFQGGKNIPFNVSTVQERYSVWLEIGSKGRREGARTAKG